MLTEALAGEADGHVWDIATRNTITIRRTKTWQTSEAEVSIRRVFVPKIETALDYLVTLHEIAHIIALPYQAPLVGEAAAWQWALDVALPAVMVEMTKLEWQRMGMCWASHVAPVW